MKTVPARPRLDTEGAVYPVIDGSVAIANCKDCRLLRLLSAMFSLLQKLFYHPRRGVDLGGGWVAKWVGPENFFLGFNGREYEIYVAFLDARTRALYLRDMPRVWTAPPGQSISDADWSALIQKARITVQKAGKTLHVVDGRAADS